MTTHRRIVETCLACPAFRTHARVRRRGRDKTRMAVSRGRVFLFSWTVISLWLVFLLSKKGNILVRVLEQGTDTAPGCTLLEHTPNSQSAAVWSYAAEFRQLHAFLTDKIGYQYKTVSASHTGETLLVVKYISNNLPRIRKRYMLFNKAALKPTQSPDLPVYQYNVSLQSAPNASHPRVAVLLVLEYNHSISEGRRDTRGRTIKVTPRIQMSRGGSALRVDTSGPHTHGFCHVEDRFDGTYLATCPIHEANTTARIQLTRQLWTQFIPSKSIRRTVATVRALHPHERFQLGLGSKSSDHEAYMQEAKVDGWWKEVSGHWAWHQNGRPVRELGTEQLKQCFWNISNLIAIGDSHMRFNMFSVFLKLGLLDRDMSSRFRGRYVRHNIAFYWSAFARDLERELKGLYKNMNSSGLQASMSPLKGDVLIINTGCHDFSSRGKIVNYVEGMERVFKVLSHLKRTKGDLLRVVWIGSTPTFDKGIRRNSEVTAAFNGWVYPRLAAIGIKVIDVFRVLYPVSNEVCDTNHYLCYNPKKAQTYGEAGRVVVNVILDTLCHC